MCIRSAILSRNYNEVQQCLVSLMRKRWKERKFFNRMLMTLSDQIANFSVEVSDENISGCKSILCRFCLCFSANILWWSPKTCDIYFLTNLLPYKMNTKSTLCDKTEERKPGGSELSAYDLSVLNMKQFWLTPAARPLDNAANTGGWHSGQPHHLFPSCEIWSIYLTLLILFCESWDTKTWSVIEDKSCEGINHPTLYCLLTLNSKNRNLTKNLSQTWIKFNIQDISYFWREI